MERNYLDQFENPSATFRGKPFWAWNCKLEKDMVLKQLEYFKEMGLGGATLHCRTGLDTEYMGEEFLDIVKACVDKSIEMDLEACLYDEDRWPSGFAGGKVTQDKAYRSRFLLFTPYSYEEREVEKTIESVGSLARGKATGEGKLLGRYDIVLENGYLVSYRRLEDGETGNNVWYAYLEVSEDGPWYNNQAYVNTLDEKAIKRFIEETHEKYYETLGEYFGKEVPSIFTDEPQFVHKTCMGKADDNADMILPYTDDFEDTYRKQYGESFLDHLPEVFWELGKEEVSLSRYRYHDHLAERFACAFSDTLGDWCRNHGISLTGHMMEEPTLRSQTAALGEAMRHYRGFQVPGIDMLCDWREYTTAKQAQSASHQLGSNKVLSEIYGVTNWDFDFRGHKLQGDWQAALGVTERVHHLSWMSMAGEAKRDYPASIFYQSAWYKKYRAIEDHFARVNTALQSGDPSVKIGVIHPVESFWLYYGPEEQTAEIREKLERQFTQVTEWLLFGMMDFNYISESLMGDLAYLEDEKAEGFAVGRMNYDAVIVPGCVTLRKATLDRLKGFAERGGKVIFMGDLPAYVDAAPSKDAGNIAKAQHIDFDKNTLLNALADVRQLDIKDHQGIRPDHFVSQLREVGEDRILFLANGKTPENIDIPQVTKLTISIKGCYEAEMLDTSTGERRKLASVYENGNTSVCADVYEEDSILVYFNKTGVVSNEETGLSCAGVESQIVESTYLNEVSSYTLSEPNVFLLDQAEYSLDGEAFRKSDEVLRIDNVLRAELGYPRKMDALAQPWTETEEAEAPHRIALRYTINTDIAVDDVMLAMEDMEKARVSVNGTAVDLKIEGYFVDTSIKKAALPGLQKGSNTLMIEMPYGRKTNLEWCYLLGTFGVEMIGNRAKIVKEPSEVGFSDLCAQKFPFYAGNFTYRVELDVEKGAYELQVSKYRAPLLEVKLDGREIGNIIFSPYRLALGELEGKHSLEITAYGNRYNSFGPLHLCDENEKWCGPNAWRSEGCAYSYEYQLRRFGILAAPQLHRFSY